jgi:hypothetical protein
MKADPTHSRAHRENLRDRDSYLDPVDYWENDERVKIKTGFKCPECKKSVLAYGQPKKCADHE